MSYDPFNNPIINTDSYKTKMWLQTPGELTYAHDYLGPRVNSVYPETVFFGLQAYLKRYMNPFTKEDIEYAEELANEHEVGRSERSKFNREGYQKLLNKHGGNWPLRISALKEGTVTESTLPQLSIETTDPEFAWCLTPRETSLLRAIWYPSSVATQGFFLKRLIKPYVDKTGTSADLAGKVHSFGARGVTCKEQAELGDMAHLSNWTGTDTYGGIIAAKRFYNAVRPAVSIAASEHFTVTSWGKDREREAYENMLDVFGGHDTAFSCVIDSYNPIAAVRDLWGGVLRDKVIAKGGIVVLRPDSGDPKTMITQLIQILDEKFGSVMNNKGYKVINHARLIQGDGVTDKTIVEILDSIVSLGYSTDNIVFGSGGWLLNHVERDTQRYSMKCSSVIVDGVEYSVNKNPSSDVTKTSYQGRVVTCFDANTNKYYLGKQGDPNSAFGLVWENGELKREQQFNEIRELLVAQM